MKMGNSNQQSAISVQDDRLRPDAIGTMLSAEC